MKIPKSVKIGAHTYKGVLRDSDHADGSINREKGEIHINTSLIGTEQTATFIHEVIHVINNELGEQDTEFLAQSITQVLIDNNLLK